jgi:hypothetical protein
MRSSVTMLRASDYDRGRALSLSSSGDVASPDRSAALTSETSRVNRRLSGRLSSRSAVHTMARGPFPSGLRVQVSRANLEYGGR